MKKSNQNKMLEEYDFSNGVRGKYVKEYKKGINIIKLDKDVTKVFPDSKSVNEALRTLIKLMSLDKSLFSFIEFEARVSKGDVKRGVEILDKL